MKIMHLKFDVTNEIFKNTVKNLQNLTSLDVSGCSGLDYKGVKTALEGKKIRELGVGGNLPKFESNDYIDIMDTFKNLIELSINQNPQIDEIVLQKIGMKSPSLQKLNMGNCGNIISKSLENTFQPFKNLRYLDIHKCSQFLPSDIILASKGWANLVSLNMENIKINEECIINLLKYCANLKELSIPTFIISNNVKKMCEKAKLQICLFKKYEIKNNVTIGYFDYLW